MLLLGRNNSWPKLSAEVYIQLCHIVLNKFKSWLSIAYATFISDLSQLIFLQQNYIVVALVDPWTQNQPNFDAKVGVPLVFLEISITFRLLNMYKIGNLVEGEELFPLQH